MARTVFVAGATGAIGGPLVRLLVSAGYRVVGMTRSSDKIADLTAAGAEPAVVDVYDAAALTKAVVAARPEIVMHQLTDLPDAMNPALLPEYFPRNARIRVEGTDNLMDAAVQAGAQRIDCSKPRVRLCACDTSVARGGPARPRSTAAHHCGRGRCA